MQFGHTYSVGAMYIKIAQMTTRQLHLCIEVGDTRPDLKEHARLRKRKQ